jgi:plasmid stability protein
MKTTLDLPDDVMRQVKIRAVHEGRKLKDLIAELIRRGLRSPRKVERVPKKRTLPVSSARGGVQRGVNLNDSAALLKRMEG